MYGIAAYHEGKDRNVRFDSLTEDRMKEVMLNLLHLGYMVTVIKLD